MNENKENLFAIHNISAVNLNKSLDLGGFPCPSIAIVNDRIGHTGYGEISVIFPMETVNPENPDNYVYSRDAWTAVAPIVQCRVDRDKLSELRDYCKSQLDDKYFCHFESGWVKFDAEYIEGEVEGFDGLEKYFEKNPFMQMAYLKSHNEDFLELKAEEKIEAIELSPDVKEVANVLSRAEMEELEAITKPDTITEENRIRRDELFKKVVEHTGKKMNALKIMGAVHWALRAGEVRTYTEWNDSEFLEDLAKKTDCEEYRAWLFKQCESLVERWGILNDKPHYREDGSKRPWGYTHDPLTLDAMTDVICGRKDQVDLENVTPFLFKYAAANRLYSMSDIFKAAEKLDIVKDEEDAKNIENGIMAQAESIADSISKTYQRDPLADNVMAVVLEAAMLETEEEVAAFLRKNSNFVRPQWDSAERIFDLKEYVNSLPTGYLEAKPHRAVGLDEIGVILLPDNQKDLKNRLEERGIRTLEYDHTRPEMRTELLKSISEYGVPMSEKEQEKALEAEEDQPKKKKHKGRSR